MVNVKAINDERLGRWKVKLNRQQATALILIGIGHDHKEGDITLLVTEERTNEEIILFLEYAIKQLQLSQN